MRCALRLIEKQVRDLRCPAAVMQSPSLICHWATGKAGRGDDAEPEELPDRNAASPLRETGRRDQSLDLCAFLRFFAKRLFYLCQCRVAVNKSCKDGRVTIGEV